MINQNPDDDPNQLFTSRQVDASPENNNKRPSQIIQNSLMKKNLSALNELTSSQKTINKSSLNAQQTFINNNRKVSFAHAASNALKNHN